MTGLTPPAIDGRPFGAREPHPGSPLSRDNLNNTGTPSSSSWRLVEFRLESAHNGAMDAARSLRPMLGQLPEPFRGESLFDQLSDVVDFIKNARREYVVVNRTLVERRGLRDKSQLIGRTASEVLRRPLGARSEAQDCGVLRFVGKKRTAERADRHPSLSGSSPWPTNHEPRCALRSDSPTQASAEVTARLWTRRVHARPGVSESVAGRAARLGAGPDRRRRHRPGESRRDRRGPGGEFTGGQAVNGARAGARMLTVACSSAPGSGLRPGSV
jgi:hypothetical protein